MSFPQVAATNSSTETGNETTHTVSLPSNIQSGNLLIVVFATDGDNTIIWPEGWNEIFEVSGGALAFLGVAWRKADGNEGASITVTSSSSEQSAHISYRITGHEDPLSQPPEVSSGETGSNATPDPDSLTPTGGTEDYLWIAATGIGKTPSIVSYPTNYSSGIECLSDGTGGCVNATAQRELNSTSENPGVFTVSSTGEWVACTIAIHPEPGSTFVPQIIMF